MFSETSPLIVETPDRPRDNQDESGQILSNSSEDMFCHPGSPDQTENEQESTDESTTLSLSNSCDDIIDESKKIYNGHQQISADGLDLFLTKMYKYYLYRGYWNIIISQITQLIIFIFFVIFCLFIFGAIDYNELLSFRDPTKIYAFSSVVYMERLKNMNVFFILTLVIFGLYLCWKIVRIVYDTKTMWGIRRFYLDGLHISDFQLSTTRWTVVVNRLNSFLRENGHDELPPWDISARIMKKDNYLIAMLHHNILRYDFRLVPGNCLRCDHCLRGCIHCINQTQRSRDVNNLFRIKIFSKILLWSITYCIINFIVNSRNEINHDIMSSDIKYIRDNLTNEIKKKLRIIGFLNLLLIPFLAIFVPIYTLFHYGEEFYKNPSNASNREWGFTSKWKFREYNELPHIFKARMHIASKYGEQYIDQFPYGVYENFAKLVTFITSSCIMFLIIVCMLNETALMNVDLTPNKSMYWWIIVLSTVWVMSRNLLKEQPIFFPRKKMDKLQQFLHYIPPEIISQPTSKHSLDWVKGKLQYKIIKLIQEFISIFINPFILWFCLGKDEHIHMILDFVRETTIDHSRLGKICEYSVFDKTLLHHPDIENQLNNMDIVNTKLSHSIRYFNNTALSDIDGIPSGVRGGNEYLNGSQSLIDEIDRELNVYQTNDDQDIMFKIIAQNKPSRL